MGHSNPDMFGPDYFMDSNVVLVSANFRLGVLGELCLIVHYVTYLHSSLSTCMEKKRCNKTIWMVTLIEHRGQYRDNL